jgi:hypothetical protein
LLVGKIEKSFSIFLYVMTSQQHQIQQQIQFTIQILNGETFPVSIFVTQAKKVYQGHQYPYNHYGLDYLKDAICSSTGTDPVSQQLICQEELTIATPLIPLVDTVIILIVKPPFTIHFVSNNCHALEKHWPCAYGFHTSITVCYLISKQQSLRVIGQRFDYIKIATADLKVADVVLHRLHPISLNLLNTTRSPRNTLYNITDNTPTHVWLRFNKEHMTIVD